MFWATVVCVLCMCICCGIMIEAKETLKNIKPRVQLSIRWIIRWLCHGSLCSMALPTFWFVYCATKLEVACVNVCWWILHMSCVNLSYSSWTHSLPTDFVNQFCCCCCCWFFVCVLWLLFLLFNVRVCIFSDLNYILYKQCKKTKIPEKCHNSWNSLGFEENDNGNVLCEIKTKLECTPNV